MDSHADTTVLGSNCVVLAYTGKEGEVSPYADEYDAIRNVPEVTGEQCGPTLRMVHQFSLYSTKPSGWGTDYTTHSSTQTNYGPTGRCARQPICKRGFGYHNGQLHHSIGHTGHHNFL